jgi:hypothetical protein
VTEGGPQAEQVPVAEAADRVAELVDALLAR